MRVRVRLRVRVRARVRIRVRARLHVAWGGRVRAFARHAYAYAMPCHATPCCARMLGWAAHGTVARQWGVSRVMPRVMPL